jgi:hypothetical protein
LYREMLELMSCATYVGARIHCVNLQAALNAKASASENTNSFVSIDKMVGYRVVVAACERCVMKV